MPPTTTGPGPLIDPPRASTPLTVSCSPLVSNSPEDRAVAGVVGAEQAVVGAREDGAGNRGDRRQQGRAAPLADRLVGLGEPDQLAGRQAHRGEPPRLGRQVVRVGEVRLLGVDREAPLDAAEGAARPDLVAPDDSAAALRVEGVARPGLLADDEEVAAVGGGHQHGRRAEVEVGAVLLRAVRVVAAAVEDERVARRELVRPADGAGLEVERDDGVARGGGGLGIGVPGRGVDDPALGVDGRRRPHRRAGRPHEVGAGGVAPARRRRLLDGVALPDQLAGRRVEGGDAAAERAAGIPRVGGEQLLQGRHRHVEPAAVLHRRPRDAGPRVGLNVPAPDLGSGRRIERVDVRREVAEEEGVPAVLEPGDGHGAPDAARGLERPVGAAGRGVEGVDDAALAGHEQAAAHHRRLRLRGGRARVAERPLEPQARHVLRRQPRLVRRLEAGVRHPRPPAVPPGTAVQPRPLRRRRGRAGAVRRRIGRLAGGRCGASHEAPCHRKHRGNRERSAHLDILGSLDARKSSPGNYCPICSSAALRPPDVRGSRRNAGCSSRGLLEWRRGDRRSAAA